MLAAVVRNALPPRRRDPSKNNQSTGVILIQIFLTQKIRLLKLVRAKAAVRSISRDKVNLENRQSDNIFFRSDVPVSSSYKDDLFHFFLFLSDVKKHPSTNRLTWSKRSKA